MLSRDLATGAVLVAAGAKATGHARVQGKGRGQCPRGNLMLLCHLWSFSQCWGQVWLQPHGQGLCLCRSVMQGEHSAGQVQPDGKGAPQPTQCCTLGSCMTAPFPVQANVTFLTCPNWQLRIIGHEEKDMTPRMCLK